MASNTQPRRFGVLGSGEVGQTLARGLKQHGYEVHIGTRTRGAENLAGKPVLDATNPISHEAPVDGLLKYFTGPNDSLMEQLQKAFPKAAFVKVFNSVGSALMVNPKIPTGRPTMFYCGNDAGAKAVVARLLEQFGWEGADMGRATAARAIEPLAALWCIPGSLHNDWSHAFRLVRP